MPAEKILDKVTDAFTSRLKVPIISTYLSILVLFNWDVLYYLCFQKLPAVCKIAEIKRIWGPVYWQRIIWCIVLAFIVLCVFTMLNTFINYLMRWFYMRDKDNTTKVEQAELVETLRKSESELAANLATYIKKNESLEKNIDDLRTVYDNSLSHLTRLQLYPDEQRIINELKEYVMKSTSPSDYRMAMDYFLNYIAINTTIYYDALFSEYEDGPALSMILNYLSSKSLVNIIGTTKKDNVVVIPSLELTRVAFHFFVNYINI